MSLTVQQTRSSISGENPDGLCSGQLAFNLADNILFLGNGSNTRIDVDGNPVLPPPPEGRGWVSFSLYGGGGGGSVNVVQGNAPIEITGPISNPIVSLESSGVTAGSYTYPTLTVSSKGLITSAANGVAPVTGVTGTAPITVTGTTAPVISITNASTTAAGVVQLVDSTTSTSITQALTANQGRLLQNQINGLVVSSNLTLAGTFNASTSTMSTVTVAGASKSFVVGSNLPVASSGNSNYFVIVTVGGTYTPPGGSTAYNAGQGDWFLSNGSIWEFYNVGFDAPLASTSQPGIVQLATNVQTQTGTDANLAITPVSAASAYIAKTTVTAKGALISGTAANTPATLAIGLDGQVLTACSTSSIGLCWASASSVPAIPCSTITAAGQLIAGTGAATFCALPIGTNGQLLTVCTACPAGILWSTPAAVAPATPTVAGIVLARTTASATALGCNAMLNVTGAGNTAVGCAALRLLTTSCNNTAIGFAALCSNTANDNTAIGTYSLTSLTTGACNIAVGCLAGACNVSGSCNVFIGSNTALCSTAGSSNTFIGNNSGYNSTGSNNTIVGVTAGSALSTGNCNVILGSGVEVSSATGSCQLAIGYAAGQNWLIGDSSKNISPGAGIRDCTGSLGVAGQALSSTGTALQWKSVACTVSGICNSGAAICMDNLKIQMAPTGCRSLQISTVSGSSCSNIQSSYCATTVIATGNYWYTLTTTMSNIVPTLDFALAGSVQNASIYYGTPVTAAYCVALIVGNAYSNNILCITRIV